MPLRMPPAVRMVQRFGSVFLQSLKHSFYGRDVLIDPANDCAISCDDFAELVQKTKRRLRAQISAGETWAVISGNSAEYLALAIAASCLGITLCPLNPALKQYEIEKYCTQAGCAGVILEHRYLERHRAMCEQLFGDQNMEDSDESHVYDVADRSEHEYISFVFFSSGTSGPPKAVEIGERALHGLVDQIRSMKEPFPQVRHDDVVYGVLPFFHAGGLLTAFAMLAQGAKLVLNDRFDAQAFCETIQKHSVCACSLSADHHPQATILSIVPPVLSLLAHSPITKHFDLSSLRLIFVGAAQVSAADIVATRTALPTLQDVVQRSPVPFQLHLTLVYGLTEAGILVFMTPVPNFKPASVGLPVAGVEMRLVPENGDTPLGPGETGELWLKTPCLLAGYRGSEQKPLTEDGWLNTGDLARVDEAGFVYIVGRTKEMIKVKGWQVSPYELESAIVSAFPIVSECAVIGIPSDGDAKLGLPDGQRPFAFIVTEANDEHLTTAISTFIAAHFITYKRLAGVRRIAELPKTASGKLRRVALLQEWEALNV